jgi:hemerythrin
MIVWDDSYSVNHAELDGQHKKWLEMINELLARLEKNGGDCPDISHETLTAMLQYARQHFMGEEKYMREIGYPETVAHIRSHNEFYGQVSSRLLAAEGGRRVPAADLLRFMRGWLLEHILDEDKKFSLHAARGV